MNADKAGAATNAEDFTKQFMSQMFGGPGQSTAAPPSEVPPPVPTAIKTRMHNMFMESILMKYNLMLNCKLIWIGDEYQTLISATFANQQQPQGHMQSSAPPAANVRAMAGGNIMRQSQSPAPASTVSFLIHLKIPIHQSFLLKLISSYLSLRQSNKFP